MPAVALSLSACAAPDPGAEAEDGFAPVYRGAAAEALDADLVRITVEMEGARDIRDLTAYADCALAGYADARGFGFARHLRTTVDEEAGLWHADAVYTMSPAIPEGSRTLDIEALSQACAVTGIPQL